MMDAPLFGATIVMCLGGVVFLRILARGRELARRELELKKMQEEMQGVFQPGGADLPPVV
ncbi:hypothetical protein RAS2_14480 [Phycisphaerae bacterium RAS2]|nr:hypothetical protein RAS2_14480 [Phycisphaerae bacterium RAS2]